MICKDADLASDANCNETKLDTTITNNKRRGRAYRKRRKKLLEIKQAEQALLSSNDSCNSTHECAVLDTSSTTDHATSAVLALDRNQIWPSVANFHENAPLSQHDMAALTAQLGFVPGNLLKITCRCRDVPGLPGPRDWPVAVLLYPIVLRKPCDNTKQKGRKRTLLVGQDDQQLLMEPFPTIYWLTHPLLRILISKLEVSGLGQEIESKLQREPQFLTQMQAAHRAYGTQRLELLTSEDLDLLRARNWMRAVDATLGVAGIRNVAAVKCLHAHAAHYVSTRHTTNDNHSAHKNSVNLVGQWVMERVQQDLSDK
jgi:hypothetical protein